MSVCAGSVDELEQVLERLDSYQSVLPEAAVENILGKAGLPSPDPQVRPPPPPSYILPFSP